MECAKVASGINKAKKKHVKDELDRIKQAEKKKRRLEKALATSAAIISKLEKKKQKKKEEEQERLDEEGAAIAEAVALHVLLGEDSDDSSKLILKKNDGLTSWDFASNINNGRRQLLVPYQDFSKYSLENMGPVSDGHGYGHFWSHWGNCNLILSSDPRPSREIYHQYAGKEGWGSFCLSADHIASKTVSSLTIGDDAYLDAYVLNDMLQG